MAGDDDSLAGRNRCHHPLFYIHSRRVPGGRFGDEKPQAASSNLFFVFLVPCLNEDRVIGATLDQLRTTAGDNSLILVIDDGSDDQTAEAVQLRVGEQVMLLRRQLPDARRGKGAALNAALEYLASHRILQGRSSQDVIICLMDADGRLDPHAPAAVGQYFQDPGVGGVQVAVRIGNRNEGLLPRLQDMEFVCYSELFQHVAVITGSRDWAATASSPG